jgi:hypothetical protein
VLQDIYGVFRAIDMVQSHDFRGCIRCAG